MGNNEFFYLTWGGALGLYLVVRGAIIVSKCIFEPKKTIETTPIELDVSTIQTQKRGRGRPKGSKNKIPRKARV